jgi:hypothetical protein
MRTKRNAHRDVRVMRARHRQRRSLPNRSAGIRTPVLILHFRWRLSAAAQCYLTARLCEKPQGSQPPARTRPAGHKMGAPNLNAHPNSRYAGPDQLVETTGFVRPIGPKNVWTDLDKKDQQNEILRPPIFRRAHDGLDGGICLFNHLEGRWHNPGTRNRIALRFRAVPRHGFAFRELDGVRRT